MGFHPAHTLPGKAARPEQLRALEALLVRLQDRGWIAREVLIDGFWEPCPSISTTAEACARLERPVVRFLRNGNDTSAIRFDWIFPDQIQVNDHTSSYAFGEEVKASLLAVAQAGQAFGHSPKGRCPVYRTPLPEPAGGMESQCVTLRIHCRTLASSHPKRYEKSGSATMIQTQSIPVVHAGGARTMATHKKKGLSEIETRNLEKLIPELASSATYTAYVNALASGYTVMSVKDTQLIATSADGKVRIVRPAKPRHKVKAGQVLKLRGVCAAAGA
jgi:hypothetical protein